MDLVAIWHSKSSSSRLGAFGGALACSIHATSNMPRHCTVPVHHSTSPAVWVITVLQDLNQPDEVTACQSLSQALLLLEARPVLHRYPVVLFPLFVHMPNKYTDEDRDTQRKDELQRVQGSAIYDSIFFSRVQTVHWHPGLGLSLPP
jgi:hypothetical protein